MDSLIKMLPKDLKCFGQALKDFNEVRLSCFGQELRPDFKEKIFQFKTSFGKLPMDVFPKAHIVFDHIDDFCDEHGPLGPFAEQSFESVHYAFKTHWKTSYKRNMDGESYPKKLLDAVVDFNTIRI